jgi:hypothetical protein
MFAAVSNHCQNFRNAHLPHWDPFRPTFFPVLMPRNESQMERLAPRLSRAAFLFSPGTSPFEHFLNPFKAAAESLRVEAIVAPVNDRAELETVVATASICAVMTVPARGV